MPTVSGPLLSVSASGSYANLITYRFSKKGFTGVMHSKPTGKPSTAQLAIRAITKQVAQAWASVSEEDRITWESLAADHDYSQFNAFFVKNFERVKNGQSITDTWPPPEPPPAISPLYVSEGCDPDVSGTYNYISEVDGHHAWKHATLDYFIFFLTAYNQCFITPILGSIDETPVLAHDGETFTGDYSNDDYTVTVSDTP